MPQESQNSPNQVKGHRFISLKCRWYLPASMHHPDAREAQTQTAHTLDLAATAALLQVTMNLFPDDNTPTPAPAAQTRARDPPVAADFQLPDDAPTWLVPLMEQQRSLKRKLDQLHRDQRKHARMMLVGTTNTSLD